MTRPSGPRAEVGHRVISTTTMSPGFGVLLLTGRNLDVHDEPTVEWNDESHSAVVHVVTSDRRGGAALENPDDATLHATVGDPFDPCDDAVAVHRLIQVAAGDEDVALDVLERAIRHHETETRVDLS